MNYYIGCDLGTSSMKLLLTDENGNIFNSVSADYPVSYPCPGWSEQSADLWWEALISLVPQLIAGFDSTLVRAIGIAGQMHGLVALDAMGKPIRPVILWNDGRSEHEVEYLNNTVGTAALIESTGNIAYAGFTLPKILWMRENEPHLFAKIKKIMLPKDYLNYKLTGTFATDFSDASGTLLLDVKNKCWSKPMLQIAGIGEDILPRLYESGDVIGTVKADIAKMLDLGTGVLVIAGAGDNAAAAIGTGTIGNGRCNVSLGTSGTVFISTDGYFNDGKASMHSFAHANGKYHLMGCMLSCASCNKWFIENVLCTKDYDAEFGAISRDKIGERDLYFLPYITGERSPINDTDVRGTFIGVDASVTRADMLLAIIEGVCFALRDNMEVARSMGIEVKETCISGGGARSELFRTVLAAILNIDLILPATEQGPAYGMAELAAVACGEFDTVDEAAAKWIRYKERIIPDPELVSIYREKYERFKLIYPSVRELYKKIKRS